MSNVRVHPEGILCQTDEKGPPALCVWTVQAPVILHCEFSWHDFVGARGSVSEGVVIQILGVFVVRILFFKCHRCLSEFFLTFRNHKQEYRPLNLKWTKEGHPPPSPSLAGAQHSVMGEVMRCLKCVNQILKEDHFLLVILTIIYLTIIDNDN